jgi:hypothetical protein
VPRLGLVMLSDHVLWIIGHGGMYYRGYECERNIVKERHGGFGA